MRLVFFQVIGNGFASIILFVDPNVIIRGGAIINNNVHKIVSKKRMGDRTRHRGFKRIKIQLIRFFGVDGQIKNAKAEGRKGFDGKPTRLFTQNQKCRPVPIGQHGFDMVQDTAGDRSKRAHLLSDLRTAKKNTLGRNDHHSVDLSCRIHGCLFLYPGHLCQWYLAN